ncbi:Imm1 family immunity protein [Streptoalloteichus hindustanus]|uniref:Immunity protein Imm1 n=1 Tax=Streptoalloteichus hindustanus TaxID=2017 RepID=A0A1M5GF64_STRHI|nr:Imm1 family immunity protein [Streptoalloteichus hindustanus]SHG02339.1 Immunity protein Imm1 [Streptoalloteichus hindustanus]
MTYSAHFHLQARQGAFSEAARTDDELARLFERLTEAKGIKHNPSLHIVERPRFGPAEVPDHGLKLDVDVAAGIGALAYFGPDFSAPSMSLSEPEIPHAPVLYRDRGIGEPFPANAVIPLEKVREAVLEFRRSGGRRPTCVEWQEADEW